MPDTKDFPDEERDKEGKLKQLPSKPLNKPVFTPPKREQDEEPKKEEGGSKEKEKL